VENCETGDPEIVLGEVTLHHVVLIVETALRQSDNSEGNSVVVLWSV
jgi:hypothetical protein